MSLRKRIQILLAFLVGVPLALLLFESYRAGRKTFLKETKRQSLQIARLQTAQADLTFEPPRLVAVDLARAVAAAGTLRGEEIRDLMRGTLHDYPFLYGVAVALDPALTPLGRFAPYFFRKRGQETESTLAYDYLRWDWYRSPVDSGRAKWIKPYFGEGGGTLMTSYSAPIAREGRIVGVAVVDLDLDGLVARLRQIRPKGGSVYLANFAGQIIAHPDLEPKAGLQGGQALGQIAELIRHPGDDMAEMLDPISGRDSWIVESPIPSLSEQFGGQNWSLVVSWPLDARLAPLGGLARRMLVLYLFLGGAALLVLNRSFDQVVTRPLRRLAERARGYAKGEFGPPPARGDEALELQELSRALESLGDELSRKAAGTPAGTGTP